MIFINLLILAISAWFEEGKYRCMQSFMVCYNKCTDESELVYMWQFLIIFQVLLIIKALRIRGVRMKPKINTNSPLFKMAFAESNRTCHFSKEKSFIGEICHCSFLMRERISRLRSNLFKTVCRHFKHDSAFQASSQARNTY